MAEKLFKKLYLTPLIFPNPMALCRDNDGKVYIADTGGNRILRYTSASVLDTAFDTDGIVGQSGTGDGQFNSPSGIAVDYAGYVYVADSGNNRIQVFKPDGSFSCKWGVAGSDNGQLNSPACLYILPGSGQMLLADKSNNRVQYVSGNSGYFLNGFGQGGTHSGQFNNPQDVCFDDSLHQEQVFVADTNNNRIQRLGAASGYFLSKVGSYGSDYTQFNAPGDVCYDIAFDQIITADSGNNHLQIFQLHSYGGNSSSEMTFAKAISDQSFSNPMAVACKYDPNDPNQVIFVADTGNNRVLKLRIQNDQQDNSPLAIFNTFKAALDANNVNAAIDCFTDTAKETYSVVLPQLQSKFSEMVADMGEMILISRDENTAVYDLLREEDGQMFGYPVAFSRDEMGDWKISSF